MGLVQRYNRRRGVCAVCVYIQICLGERSVEKLSKNCRKTHIHTYVNIQILNFRIFYIHIYTFALADMVIW